MSVVSLQDAWAPNLRFKPRLTPVRLAIMLTLSGFLLRMLDLGVRPLWLDEAFSAWFSEHSLAYLWHVLPTYEAHPPLFYSVLRLWRLAVGSDNFAMRSLSAVLGTLTIPIVVAIAFEQERQAPSAKPMLRAGMAGFLTACSPMLVAIGQEARPYPLLTFSYSLAILSLIRLSQQLRRGEAGTWQSWILLGASAALTGWSHALGLLYVCSIALALVPALLTTRPTLASATRAVATALLLCAVYLPCLLMMSGRTQEWGTNWLQWEPRMFVPQLLALYTVPVEALTIASAIAAVAMVLLLKRAIVSTWSSEGWNCDRLMLLLWLGPPVLAALISALFEPVFLARTLSGTLVPAYLMIAGSIARDRNPGERRLIASAVCIALLPTAVAMATRAPSERWDDLSVELRHRVAAVDQIWLYPADSALPLASIGAKLPGTLRPIPEPFPTLHFRGPVRAGWRGVVSITADQATAFAQDPSLKDVPVIWLVTRQSAIFDPASDLPAALRRVRRAGASKRWGYIGLQPFYRR